MSCEICQHEGRFCDHERGWRRRRREVYRGDTWAYQFQVAQEVAAPFTRRTSDRPLQPPPGCAPVNLTGFKLWLTIKFNVADGDGQAVSQVTLAGGGIVLNSAASGLATATTPASALAAFPDAATRCHYDVQLADASGAVSTVESGELWVLADVTRATS